MKYLLNSAVIPVGCDGVYRYRTVSKEEAVTWLQTNEFESRVGYPENALFIHRISGVHVMVERSEHSMEIGDEALVLRLVYRQQDGNKRNRTKPTDEDFIFGIMERLL